MTLFILYVVSFIGWLLVCWFWIRLVYRAARRVSSAWAWSETACRGAVIGGLTGVTLAALGGLFGVLLEAAGGVLFTAVYGVVLVPAGFITGAACGEAFERLQQRFCGSHLQAPRTGL